MTSITLNNDGGFLIGVTAAGFVGTIAVSGLRHDLDHAFIVEAVSRFLELPTQGGL